MSGPVVAVHAVHLPGFDDSPLAGQKFVGIGGPESPLRAAAFLEADGRYNHPVFVDGCIKQPVFGGNMPMIAVRADAPVTGRADLEKQDGFAGGVVLVRPETLPHFELVAMEKARSMTLVADGPVGTEMVDRGFYRFCITMADNIDDLFQAGDFRLFVPLGRIADVAFDTVDL